MMEPRSADEAGFGIFSARGAEPTTDVPAPAAQNARSAALKVVGQLERVCGPGAALVSAVAFDAASIRLRMSTGEEMHFADLDRLRNYVQARRGAAAGRTAEGPEAAPGSRERWEQWWELLLELAGCPTWFEDLHPRLEVASVQRLATAALVTVGDGQTTEVYRMALDEGHQFPVGIADDIRFCFGRDVEPVQAVARRHQQD